MLGEIELYLARPYNVVRKMVDEAFAGSAWRRASWPRSNPRAR